MSHTDVLFRDLHADDLPEVTEVQSLCFNCHEQGLTKLLLTRIPFFRDVIVSSFKCDECGFSNTNLDSAGKIQNKGVKIIFKVSKSDDLNRKMVQGKNSTLKLLDSEFPVSNGVLTTIEGAITAIISNIQMLQNERRKVDPKLAESLDGFIAKLSNLLMVDDEFVIELSDPSGNSIIENPYAPKSDPSMTVEYFKRSKEENELLGLDEDDEIEDEKTYADEAQSEFKPKEEIVMIPVNCPKCNAPTETRMKMLNIPHFKDVIIMATNCEACGLKENEVKGGCGIADKGQEYTLKIEESIDLARDLLKSETANICVPELEIETSTGVALGGRFTTVEGIIRSMADQLLDMNPFVLGDSTEHEAMESPLKLIIHQLHKIADGSMKATLVMKDPAGNSYIQDIYKPELDPRLSLVEYERSYDENEELGVNDMVTENYDNLNENDGTAKGH